MDGRIQFITVNGLNLAFREARPEKAHTLLLLHGLAEASHYFWDTIFDDFQEYRIIAFDLLGHGKSPVNVANYSAANQARLIKSAIDILGVKAMSIMAHSLGGSIALAFAVQYPHCVEKLILYSVPISRGWIRTISEMTRNLSPLSLLPGLSLLMPFSGYILNVLPAVIRRGIYRMIFWQWNIPYRTDTSEQRAILAKIVDIASATNGIGIARTVRNTFLFSKLHEQIPQITQPILLIKGSHDFILSDRMVEGYTQLFPNAKLIVVRDASHISLLEQPVYFVNLVSQHMIANTNV